MIHVAILKAPYIQLVLAGRKTVESRLSKVAMPPYREIAPGERLFFKASGGPFMATARADRCVFFDSLTPAKINTLKDRYNPWVCGDDAYWHAKRQSQCASFILLRDVEPIDVGPRYAPSAYRAWFVLGDDASPLVEVRLTDGAIRNRYVRIPKALAAAWPAGRVTLTLPDGREVVTRRLENGLIQWRGWGAHYQAHAVAAGDAIRFVAHGHRRYVVSFPKRFNHEGTKDTKECREGI